MSPLESKGGLKTKYDAGDGRPGEDGGEHELVAPSLQAGAYPIDKALAPC